MKKFITTSENPLFIEGIQLRATFICKEGNDRIEFLNGEDKIVLPKSKFENWLKKGWIKEVEEKEFTRSEAIDFHFWSSCATVEISIQDFEDWLKQRE